ncbi:MAG: single-stranded DNA-binding protein [Verrucomicrobiales bacterium]|jgi:single-strand DNA-binding protein|nr:single-stranded DNA-binding protein [Verrucomicrobiales bacterium]MDP4849460.1 single-stranded DNA-binding protein [Verrucomicrobiales bacterium]MDP4939882.1 single-stranded DNA-binding protein [Verrucomicrobiales bacterium]MDP5005878.1 single-stranded DNA-binding protein [Verrucomicrobiales bacterium]
MPNLNKVQLMGNITRDPEVRYTPKGTAVTDISLAINRSFNSDDGERREETTFVDITFWGRQAEVIGEYMKKGRPLYVEGRLQLDSWEDKTSGQQRSRLKVVGENFQFLGGRDDAGGGGGGGGGGGQSRSAAQAPYSGGGGGGSNEEYHDSRGDSAPEAAPRQQSSPPQHSGPIDDDDDIPF